MSETATIQAADGKPKPRDKAEYYNEAITVKRWDGDKFLDPRPAMAFRDEIQKKSVFVIRQRGANKPTPKSEIIDKDGGTWIVTQVKEGGSASIPYWLTYVMKKPK